MNSTSVLIISDDLNIGKNISEKINLLRECDSIQLVTCIEAVSVLNSTQPSLIIVYTPDLNSAEIVKGIRTLNSLQNVPIVLVLNDFNEKLLLSAFDYGIDDFFFLEEKESVILMRILLVLQKNTLNKKLAVYKDILLTEGIIDNEFCIFTKEQTPIVFKHFFSKSIEENLENTVFLCLKPFPIPEKIFNINEFISDLRKIPRSNDIIAFGENDTIYIILYNSGIKGAKSFISRIKKSIKNKYKLFAAAAEITTSFEELEPVLLESLKEQISNNIEFNYLNDKTVENKADIIDIKDETGKKFKDFKREFFNSFEKISAPIFYQMKIQITQTMPDVKADFDIKETESIFTVKKNSIISELIITYPSYMKLLIDIKHTIENSKTKSRRITFDFEDFSDEKLLSILQDVIKEFENKINKIEKEQDSDFKLE